MKQHAAALLILAGLVTSSGRVEANGFQRTMAQPQEDTNSSVQCDRTLIVDRVLTPSECSKLEASGLLQRSAEDSTSVETIVLAGSKFSGRLVRKDNGSGIDGATLRMKGDFSRGHGTRTATSRGGHFDIRIPKDASGSIEISTAVSPGFPYCILPADPPPGLPLLELCDTGPIFLRIARRVAIKEEGLPAK